MAGSCGAVSALPTGLQQFANYDGVAMALAVGRAKHEARSREGGLHAYAITWVAPSAVVAVTGASTTGRRSPAPSRPLGPSETPP